MGSHLLTGHVMHSLPCMSFEVKFIFMLLQNIVHTLQDQTFQVVKMAVSKSLNVKDMLYLGHLPFKHVFVRICFHNGFPYH